MLNVCKTAFRMLALMTLLTGILYPFTVTGIAQFVFPYQADGSLIRDSAGQIVGSALIGQSFQNPDYFWSRPSATSPYPYNALASGGSNLGPTNPALTDAVKQRLKALQIYEPDTKQGVPVDLITASASGLDPHISPAAAIFQIKRISERRHLTTQQVQDLISQHTEARQWGILGEKRVNVLALNRALDELALK